MEVREIKKVKEIKSVRFFRLYNHAQKRLYSYLLMLVHNHNDAEDLLQETASILWEQFHKFDKEGSFAAWAIGIARNKAFDFLRSKRNSRPLFDDEFYNDISKSAKLESKKADKRYEALRSCVKKLSRQDQRLVNLRFERGISVKKISQIFGNSVDAIYKRMSRMYGSLRACINGTLLQWEQQ